jgi:hypothetical protein
MPNIIYVALMAPVRKESVEICAGHAGARDRYLRLIAPCGHGCSDQKGLAAMTSCRDDGFKKKKNIELQNQCFC